MRARSLLLGLCTLAGGVGASDGNPELWIGSLFPMFQTDGRCDKGGTQRFHAFLMAVAEINNRTDLLQLGDGGRVQLKIAAEDSKRDTATTAFVVKEHMRGVHVIVGAASSTATKAALETTSNDKDVIGKKRGAIPQISYSATSPELSNGDAYPYFMRMPPTDEHQALAMADLTRLMNKAGKGWTNVFTISSRDTYGTSGMQAFVDAASRLSLQLATGGFELSFPPGGAAQKHMDEIIGKLQKRRAKLIVLFCGHADAFKLIQLAHQASPKLAGRGSGVQWILPDSVGTNHPPTGYDTEVRLIDYLQPHCLTRRRLPHAAVHPLRIASIGAMSVTPPVP